MMKKIINSLSPKKKKKQENLKKEFAFPHYETQLFASGEESCYPNLLELMNIYNQLDLVTKAENKNNSKNGKTNNFKNILTGFIKSFDELSSSLKRRKSGYVIERNTLENINIDVLYFVLNVSIEEFHEFFIDFYRLFDHDNNLELNKEDFRFIINYMGGPDKMGKEKINISVDYILNQKNFINDAFDKLGLFFSNFGGQGVLPELVLENLFSKLKEDDDDNIDLLKFLPFLLSYFLEYIKKRIEIRRKNLDMLKGMKENESLNDIKKTTKNTSYNKISLLYRFEALGFHYHKQKYEKMLTYRDIEKILIIFHNSYNGAFNVEQLELILQELQKKMNVDPLMKVEFKKKKFIHILNWIAMKIGLHACCYELSKKEVKKGIKYIEESILWTCATYSYKLNKDKLYNRFINFVEKQREIFNEKTSALIIERFLIKLIPHITHGDLINILKSIDLEQDYLQIGKSLYKILIQNVENKLKSYVKKFFHNINKSKKSKKKKGQKSNDFNFNVESPTPDIQDYPKNNSLRSFSNNLNNSITPLEKKSKINLEIEEKITDKSINEKSINLNDDETKFEKKPDLLNSCFIMEEFLEKFLYYYKKIPKDNKEVKDEEIEEESKENKSLNVSALDSGFLRVKTLSSSTIINPIESTDVKTQKSKQYSARKIDIKQKERSSKFGGLKDSTEYDEKEIYKTVYFKEDFEKIEIPKMELEIPKNIDKNRLLVKNEFSNNINNEFYLSKNIKKKLKNQRDLAKKKPCMSCQFFEVEKCRLF